MSLRSGMILGAVALLALVVGALFLDEGEVATLVTLDDQGRHVETRLWIVDVEGAAYVRASTPRAGWVKRLRAHPEVRLERGATSVLVRAVPVDDGWTRDSVSERMRGKYGLLGRFVVWMRGTDRGVPVRLEPITASHP